MSDNEDTITISKRDADILMRAKGLLDKAISDKDKGQNFKRTLKEIDPSLNFPDLDIVDAAKKPLEEKIAAQTTEVTTLRERLDKIEKDRLDRDEEGALSKQLSSTQKSYGFTEAGMEKVIARMKEKNNPDVDAAAAWVAQQERKIKPVSKSKLMPDTLNLYGTAEKDDNFDALQENPVKFLDDEITRVMNEFAEAAE